VFAVSCSGNTEETISAAESAWSSGATVVAVTSGGTLGAMAERAGSLCIKVPSAIPQPRAALGAMAVPPLIVLEQLGLLPGAAEEISRSVDQLARRRDQLMKPANLAEEVARTIGRTMPLVYGSSGLGSVAAQRWKTQVNENAKSPAFWSAQPELCHNELAGWGQHGDVTRQVMTVVALRQKNEHPQVARRFDFVAEELREVVSEVVDVWAEGEGSLPMFFDLAIFGDFVSLNLAANEGIDPGPIPALDQIKERLSQPS